MADHDSILAGNAAFYDAFKRGDLTAMAALWAEDDNISCIHPGWSALVGRKAVLESWRAILGNGGNNDIVFHDPYPIVSGNEGRVLCLEAVASDLLQAVNHFRLIDGVWRLVHHQSGLISVQEPAIAPPGARPNYH